MRISIRHVTTHVFEPAADWCALRARLFPAEFASQRVAAWEVTVNGQAVRPLARSPAGDAEALWLSHEPVPVMEVVAQGEVETIDAAGVVAGLKEAARPGVWLRTTALTEADAAIIALARAVRADEPLARLHALCEAVHAAVAYTPAATTSRTTAAEALKRGEGVCQDHAHIFIAAARALGFPARYAVGYLLAEGTQTTETHAWAEAWTAGLGWVGFDPANRICPTERYVRLGCGFDAFDAAPLRGARSTASVETLSAHVAIAQTQQ
jgi:transglutaminase-like putative cysteine protease